MRFEVLFALGLVEQLLSNRSLVVFICGSIVLFQVENFRNSLGLGKQNLVILCANLIIQALTLVIR